MTSVPTGPSFGWKPIARWDPEEMGMPRATVVAVALVIAIAGFCYWASVILAPKPKLQPIQVTQAQLVQLPAPTPPPPPKIIPPPKPVPAVIPKPPPVPSKIVVATKPPPPVHHVVKPAPRPVIHHAVPRPPRPVPHPAPRPTPPAPVHTAPAPAPVPTSGIPIYGQQMYEILQANQNVPQALAQLGVSGTAIIRITVAPDGHVISARIIKSSGIPLIDQTALAHAREAHFAAFNRDMPGTPLTFTVPVEIQPQPDGD